MSGIYHQNKEWANVTTPNPAGTASTDLTKLGIDGVNYNVKDADAYHDGDLATVAETGSYSDLSNTPSIPTKTSDLTNDSGFVESSDLATVATSGSYNDLTNKPTIPAAQVNSDWDASSGVAEILNKPTLATVATSGSYNDLSNKPTIPTVNNGTLTIQKNGTQVATFSANQSGNATANIECANPSDVEGSKVETGNPLTITDAAGIKAEKIEIGFEPKQDLHGYDKPWVGGAGKNKLPVNESTITGGAYIFNTSIDIPAGTWTFSFKSSVTTNTSLALLDANGNYLVNEGINDPRRSHTFTISTAAKTARFYGYAGTYYDMQIESGNQATTFAPYSNISPITGYTSLSADGCGKNFLNINGAQDTTYATGTISGSQITVTGRYYLKIEQSIPAGTYTFSFTLVSQTLMNGVRFVYDDGTQTGIIYGQAYVDTNGKKIVSMLLYSGTNTSGTSVYKDMQLETASLPTTYEAYKPKNVTIQLGQTLYGGKLTILQDGSADVDCVLGIKTITELNAGSHITRETASGRVRYVANISDMEKKTVRTMANLYSDRYETISDGRTYANCPDYCIFNRPEGGAFINEQRYSSVSDFVAANGDSVIVYPLATPFTIHLSQVETLTLLQGINNVWTDGTTLSLTYQPDNAIGQAKGTAQDAMAMVNALANTAVKVIAKNGEYDASVYGLNDMPNCSLSLDKGTYLIMAWCYFTVYNIDTNKEYGCAICNSSNTILSYDGHKNRTESAEGSYGATSSTFILETITTDATVRKLRGYMCKTVTGNPIRGGIVAFKIA